VYADSLLAVFVFSYLASFGAVISPGPVTAAIFSESPRAGWRVGPLIASGHSFLELILVVLISFGLTAGMTQDTPRIIIAVLGGTVLIALGASYILQVMRGTIRLPTEVHAVPVRSNWALVMLGIVTTISNPFWYTWWVTVAAGYLSQAWDLGSTGVVVFYLGHISADFSWDTLLSTSVSAGRRWLTPTRYHALILLTGLFMLYLGVSFLRSVFIS
jgi:threonine/homoserine/homoserine lactone efflux protein